MITYQHLTSLNLRLQESSSFVKHSTLNDMVCTKETVEKNGINVWVDKARDGGEPSVDIILVQGLGSHPYYTWTGRPELETRQTFDTTKRDALKGWLKRERSRTPVGDLEQNTSDFFWPRDLLPSHIPSAAIVTYSYESGWRSKSVRTELRKCGEQFLNLLHQYRQQNAQGRPIVFVGHSLGGLVVQQALVLADHGDEFADIRQSMAGAIFLGVPMQGSDAAGYANWAINAAGRSSRAILETLQSGSQELFSLTDDFWRSYGKLPIAMFYENAESDYGPLKVRTVEFHSATMTGRRRIYLWTDHSGLNKFHGDDDENFKPFIHELKQITQSITKIQPAEPSLPTVSAAPENARQSVEKPTGVMCIPFTRDKSFVNRGDVMNNLLKLLYDTEDNSRAAIVGLGGVGKSQIAIEFAYRVRERFPHTSIFWVHASNPARFRSSYQMIATEARVPGLADPKSNVMEIVYRWLQSESSNKWLLVVDNADDIDFVRPQQARVQGENRSMNIAQYLPQRQGGTVLVTSRYRDAAFALVGKMDRIIAINPMSETESQVLIDRSIPQHLGSDQERRDLISRLENLPLALSQAAAYITKAQRMSIGKYLRMFEKGVSAQQTLLMKDHGDLRRDPELTNSIIWTWQVSFDQILSHSSLAVELMSLMAMFDRNDIPTYLLSEDDDDIETEEAIEVLLGYSFISEGVDSNSLSMHRLVQLATKQWLKSKGEFEKQNELALAALVRAYPEVDHKNWDKCSSLEPHAQALLQDGDLSRSVQILQAKLNSYRADYTCDRGDYVTAEAMARECYDTQIRLLGPDHLDTLHTANILLDVYADYADFNEFEKLGVKTLESARRTVGNDHATTIRSMVGLASVYLNLQRLDDAEELINEVMATTKRLSTDNVDALHAKELRLTLTIRRKQWSMAETLAQNLIRDWTDYHGAEHMMTLATTVVLADIYRNQARWADAERVGAQVLEVESRVFGMEAYQTLYSMSDLADTLIHLERWEDAEHLLLEVIATRKRTIGPDHQWTLDNMCELGYLYYKRNRLEEAETMLARSIEGRARTLGLEHRTALRSIEIMALIVRKRGRTAEALERLGQSVELSKIHLGAQHATTLWRIDRMEKWRSEYEATLASSITHSSAQAEEPKSILEQGSEHSRGSHEIHDQLAGVHINQDAEHQPDTKKNQDSEDGWISIDASSKDGS